MQRPGTPDFEKNKFAACLSPSRTYSLLSSKSCFNSEVKKEISIPRYIFTMHEKTKYQITFKITLDNVVSHMDIA
jgi:hypothetical protein